MRTSLVAVSLFAIAILSGCAKENVGGNSSSPESLPKAPSSWMAGEGSGASDSSLAQPSEDFAASVQSSFQAHATALESLSSQSSVANVVSPPPGAPQDWVPWHLDGLIGGFGFDVGGIFGTLAIDGAPSVKVTWQKTATSAQPKAKSPRSTSIRFNSSLSNQDVSALIEPAVALAVSSKRVHDPRRLRSSLGAEAARFLSFVRILSTVKPASAWHVDGYQLSLSVSASGDVTPEISVGGTFLVIFDWQATGDSFSPVANARMTPQEAELQPKIAEFARNVETILPMARASASEIRKIGFEFQVFQVGLGITAGGDIGIASAQGFVGGRVIFKKDSSPQFISETFQNSGLGTIQIIGPGETRVESATRDAREAFASTRELTGNAAFEVPANRFVNGLSRAIRMGTFFAKQAVSVESANWKTTEIELGLDASVGGNIGLVTLAGSGLIRLGFERVER